MTDVPATTKAEKNHWTVPTAIFGSVLFVVVAVVLFNIARDKDLTETVWNRLVIVYNSIASVGFACFGVLLGTTVQNAKLIEAKADSAKKGDAMKKAIGVLNQQEGGSGGAADFRQNLTPSDASAAASARAEEASRFLLHGLS
jgi:hypothetical protein